MGTGAALDGRRTLFQPIWYPRRTYGPMAPMTWRTPGTYGTHGIRMGDPIWSNTMAPTAPTAPTAPMVPTWSPVMSNNVLLLSNSKFERDNI